MEDPPRCQRDSGGDAFVIASDHAMWPGHSRVYRYLWKDSAWSGPLDVAGTPQSVADYLAACGYIGSPLAFFVDRTGGLHMVVSGTKDGGGGSYYVQP